MEDNRPRSRSRPLSTTLLRRLPLGDLLALGAQLRADITPEALLKEVAEAIVRVLGFPHTYIRLRNADTDELEACAFAGLDEATIACLRAHPTAPTRYQALLQTQYRLSESLLVPASLTIDCEFPSDQTTLAHNLVAPEQHFLIVPLRGGSDRLIGAIYAIPPDEPGALELTNIQVLEAIARQAALALENARLAARTARLLAKEQLLAELGRDIGTARDLNTILAHAIERLKMAFLGGSIALLNEQEELEIVASIGRIDEAARQVRLKVGEGICGWVVQNGLPFLSNDIPNETRVKPVGHNVGTNRFIQSYIVVPLRSGGKVIGSLNVESDHINAFTYEDVDLLEAVAAQISGTILSVRLYQETQRLAEQVKRRNEHLMVLNTLARMVVSTLDIEQMLATVSKQIQQGFGYGHVELFSINEEAEEFVQVAEAGPLARNLSRYCQPFGQGLLARTYRTAKTCRIDDVQHEPDLAAAATSEARAVLCVPVVAGGRVLALLNVESRRVAAFTDEDVGVLETTADILASALENARLHRRAQEAAVIEERSRLARDLHDSVSQQLFSMTLTAQAARAQLDKNPARAAVQLERLQETASAALAEMRALIFQLRPSTLNDQGLIAALQQHVTALSRREGITINLNVTGNERAARGVEQTIYRIVQEALNNVLKHAGACKVDIALDLQSEQIKLHIVDNGRGFDPAQLVEDSGLHLGLIGMRERAAEIGGRMELHSQLGQGTEVLVIVPRVP